MYQEYRRPLQGTTATEATIFISDSITVITATVGDTDCLRLQGWQGE